MQPHERAKAHTKKKTFSRETSISIDINADVSIVWSLLTNASDLSRWNTTIISVDGDIRPSGKIKLTAKLDPGRTFKLSIKEFQPETRLVWGDGMGNRVYTLKKTGNNTVRFTMLEKIGGPLFPLFAKMIPSFDESFEQFAQDLKNEAEKITNTK